jgi:tRNA dimethylallyltransferase
LEFKAKNLTIILGPTGVGKSTTAIKLALLFNGEIINCDSMQVYRGFDIGTDKTPPDQRENIPHYLLDIAHPLVQFTAADFVDQTMQAISTIIKKKHLPIIAGGTGLYLKALLDGLFPGGEKNPIIRQNLEKKVAEQGLPSLYKELQSADPEYAHKTGANDKIRIIRALEIFYATNKPISEHFSATRSFVSNFNIVKIGLKLERIELYQRIEERVDRMFAQGIVREVQSLLAKGIKQDSPPFRALGYKQVLRFLNKEISLDETIYLIKKDTRHYAKRQITWFKKMDGISWFSPKDFAAIKKYLRRNLQ